MNSGFLEKLSDIYFRVSRLMIHFGRISQLMVGFLFFDRIGWEWIWVSIPLAPIIYALHTMDKKYILSSENRLNFKANPYFQKILADMESRIIAEIKK